MTLRFTTDLSGITPAQLTGFFVGWPNPPDPATHLRLLLGSSHVVLALDDDTGQVIGFITVLSDGVLMAYIPLLEVLPSYQGRGIGSDLVRRSQALVGDLYALDLCCDVDLMPFYKRLGLQQLPAAMGQRNYGAQAGKSAT